ARAYLGHLGIQRHELMRAFQRPGAPPDPAEIAIAGERLGLTTTERLIVTGNPLTPPRQPWEFWGYPADAPGTWTNELTQLQALIDASALTYETVLDLLQTAFINPTGTITIVSSDQDDPATCDTSKLWLDGLDQAALDRLHRFARLQARLGWTPYELDLAIS